MILRQLFDSASFTYTYILACSATGKATVIDPVFDQHTRDTALIRELGLDVLFVLDTHCHADHVTGAWIMARTLKAKVALSAQYGAENVDLALAHGDVLEFGRESLAALATPGHTNGCMTFVTGSKDMAFTGDCLMIRGAGRTDFQAGDIPRMWHSIQEKIFTLPDSCRVYPGHDYLGRTVSTVGEEKLFNPRIGGGALQEDFVGYMENMHLKHPKLMDIAVPANMKSGRPLNDLVPGMIDWGPVVVTFAGVPEIAPDWVDRHLNELFVVDVRSREEFNGGLGHIRNAALIPLDQLRERSAEIPRDKAVVAVCQSGKRSAMATEILKSSGYEKVASLSGGLIQWSRLALPVEETT